MLRRPAFAALVPLLSLAILAACATQPGSGSGATRKAPAPMPLFATDGPPAGWTVRNWVDVSQEPPPGAKWLVRDGVLTGSEPRGTWLVSDAEYGDFAVDFEFRLGERGNGGFGFRFPASGEPAFEGFELQLVDPRYFGPNYPAPAPELTGAIYKAVAPMEQNYRPADWNSCSVTCLGSRLTVLLNGRTVIDLDLTTHTTPLFRGKPLAERPRRGHLGFQEASRGGGHVEIRNARLRVLDAPTAPAVSN